MVDEIVPMVEFCYSTVTAVTVKKLMKKMAKKKVRAMMEYPKIAYYWDKKLL